MPSQVGLSRKVTSFNRQVRTTLLCQLRSRKAPRIAANRPPMFPEYVKQLLQPVSRS
jgi:hypothetical protein